VDRIEAPGELAALLEEHRIGILSSWLEQLFQLPAGHYEQRPVEEVRSWASAALSAVIQYLTSEDVAGIAAQADLAREVLGPHGFGIDEVVEGLLLLKESASPFIQRYHDQDTTGILNALRLLDACLRRLIGKVSTVYATAMLSSIEKAQARTALLLDAAETAGSSLDPLQVLNKVVKGFASALRVSFCGIYEAEGDVYHLRSTVGQLSDSRLQALFSRPLRADIDPLVNEIVNSDSPQPKITSGKAPFLGQVTCRSLNIGPAVMIPIAVSGRVMVLALGVCMDPSRVFSEQRIQLAWGIACTVGPAVNNAYLYAATRWRLAESQGLQKISDALLGRQPMPRILEILCEETRNLVDADASILLCQNEEQQITIEAKAGEMDVSIPDLLEQIEPGGLSLPHATPAISESVLAIPLATREQVFGTLVILDRNGGFGEIDRQRIQPFVNQGAIAVEYARMSDEHDRLVIIEERQKLARDLHDSVTQSLYGISMYAEAAGRLADSGDTEKLSEYLSILADSSLDALREMRLLIFELRPPDLNREGLAGALKTRLAVVEARLGLVTHAELDSLERLPAKIEENLHGIAREALNNILKHAKASTLWIILKQVGTDLSLTIRDDGIGFDISTGSHNHGWGLRDMAERADHIGARLTIDSAPESGTTITVICPFQEAPDSPQPKTSANEE
jgi:signal transduction histidine kinase